MARSKVWRICKVLEPSFSPWWDWKSHDFWSRLCCHFLSLGLNLLIWAKWDRACQSLRSLLTQRKIPRLKIIKITWYTRFPWSGIFSYESRFRRWRKERKWRDRTVSKEKKTKNKKRESRCSILIFSREVQPLFKALDTDTSCHTSLTHRAPSKLVLYMFLQPDLRNKESWRQKG